MPRASRLLLSCATVGPLDANRYLSDPLNNLAEQTGGFEKAFRRFIQACAAHQDACHGFGGDDPLGTFDDLADRLDRTPYRGAQRLVADLGNARLLTMRGDGHTSYHTGSPDCIDTSIENYLNTLLLPPAGTVCKQQPPFAAAKGPEPLAVPDLLRTLR